MSDPRNIDQLVAQIANFIDDNPADTGGPFTGTAAPASFFNSSGDNPSTPFGSNNQSEGAS